MKLFTISNQTPIPTTECYLVPEFAKLLNRDKTKDKSTAFKELQYVYFKTDYKSLYLSYDEELREEKLINDFIGKDNWKPDTEILKAVEKYKELQKTPSIGFLEDAMKAVDATRRYFRDVDYSLLDTQGKPVYKIKEVTSSLKDCEGVLNTLDKLKEKIEKEQKAGGKARGGGSGGLLEFD